MNVIGIDFGTDSVRALIVDAKTGKELGTAVSYYTRWKKGLFCIPEESQFRQHPQDYIDALTIAVKEALAQAGETEAKKVVGISVDTTGSTPVAVNQEGVPLALTEGFEENPNAMFILWKDHTANLEAEEINELARKWDIDFTKYVGGIYSSEWFWAKILKTLRTDSRVRNAAYSWVEHCDWISAMLTGNTNPLSLKRSRCAAGHKAMWHEEFGGLPSQEFLSALDPVLDGIRDRLFQETFTSDQSMGSLSKEWAAILGLPVGITIGVGAFDAHMGGVGAEIKAYSFVRVMGTSTCDMLVAPNQEMQGKLIPGICGQVDGSILPGMLGMEAGQSAYGDVYAWFQRLIVGPISDLIDVESAQKIKTKIIPYLSEKAKELSLNLEDPIAIDWFNGRRTPDANHRVKGAIAGMNLGTTAPMVFKTLVEATAFGSKAIVDRFLEQKVPIKEVIAIGGVAQKSDFVMQTLSDVLNMPIKLAASEQTCALGAAMCAATAAGVYSSIEEAQKGMGAGFKDTYTPNENNHNIYLKRFAKYQKLGEFVENNP